MSLNKYFNQTRNAPEQDLFSDLLVEVIQIGGVDALYIKREVTKLDKILSEPTAAQYKDTYTIEMFFPNAETSDGNGFYMSNIGLNFNEVAEFYLSIRRWNEVVGDDMIRPREGDLVYIGNKDHTHGSYINRLYQIKNVTLGLPERGQFGKNHAFKLIAEIYTPEYDKFDTDINDIDENYNTYHDEEFINSINVANFEEAQDIMVQTENPLAEKFKDNKLNNPFGDDGF